MSAVLENNLGKIDYSEDFLASYVGLITTECFGVVGMTSQQKMSDGIAQLLGKDVAKKGVKIEANGDEISVKLYIIVQYGIQIVATVNEIINTVKYNLEKATGLTVKNVDVVVSGIRVAE